ncbi:RagB/SusD family nutrient uptake outer membrane protein [Bacteroides sp. 51]|uniref:RagB/SusD family nutrient uptake outer membrane protein n=1 Tax=Bacteroides sp. 51 TaxID=2302938 RepID=UPI001EF2FCFA|nr:RagB/SusD family nutrient uptake outer membrane protein [Bacteroides sp. 51]
MKKVHLLAGILLFSISWLVSCQDLDLIPTSIITEKDIYNENGIKAYMAGMYNYLPMEDFHYDTNSDGQIGGGYYVGNGISIWNFWNSTGEMVNRNNTNLPLHRRGYWNSAFQVIRKANTLVKNLPNYPELEQQSKSWIAEAKFLRAYVYFQLAKRYGGMPKILEPQSLDPNDDEALWIARESHADTYDFILKDLDEAIADLPETSEAGRANKYVAAAIKCRAALHAATTARYGSMKFTDWEVDGVLLQGIPSSKANDYFKTAWDAAKMIEDGDKYELHRANGDKTENYAEVWEKADGNKESIWLRKYDFSMSVHSFNSIMAPPRMCSEGGDRYNPTLDWVELFDGLPLDEKGNFSAFDENGDYIVYDDCQQLWNGAEPRLRANILIPGNLYKGGMKLDLRAGIIKEEYDPATDRFKKFTVDDGKERQGLNSGSVWNKAAYPKENPFRARTIFDWSADPSANQKDPYKRSDGVTFFKNGLDGPRVTGSTNTSNTVTGFFGRKHLNITLPKSETVNHTSTQPWIEIRYAEVLLNRAEAAIELAQNGVDTYRETDMLNDAFKCINDVRDRAGANLLTSPSELSMNPAFTRWDREGPKGQGAFVEAPTRGLQIVRVERYKELAFESKIYWDLMRWFTYDTQIRNYFRRGLYPIMYAKGATVDENGIPNGKYIYDAKSADEAAGMVTFAVNNYYEGIPSAELKNNPLLQKNRNQ